MTTLGKIVVALSGGCELLFNKETHLSLEHIVPVGGTVAQLIGILRHHFIKERPDLFVDATGSNVRPGILILVNGCDVEVLGGVGHVLEDGDEVEFVSTLHDDMLNVNIGLLGHVDSGKTALAKALSKTPSTAAFDKSPQSQSRGITLDLGFSACEVSADGSSAELDEVLGAANLQKLQCTLVDCPGHASLIRTIVGGAQIIDAIILVIDATKGIQAQTAECLVLGEVLSKPLVVALNKIDAIQGSTVEAKDAARAELRRKLQLTFRRTRWPSVPVVEVAAAPRDATGSPAPPLHTELLLPQVLRAVDLAVLKAAKEVEADRRSRFYMLVDHCFAVRGQGTVFTGTVAAGVIHVGDTVLIPEAQVTRKVKGLQVFHTPVESARGGDRVGLCVAQFDPTTMERGVLCSAAGGEGAVVSSSQLLARVHRVRYHPLPCDAHTKFHITIGHTTVMGLMRYFKRRHLGNSDETTSSAAIFDPTIESEWVEKLEDEAVARYGVGYTTERVAGRPLPPAIPEDDYYAVLLLERPVQVVIGSALIAMRLDVERENFCRIALAGTVCYVLKGEKSSDCAGGSSSAIRSSAGVSGSDDGRMDWRQLPVVRYRSRTLRVDRVLDSRSCIADGVVSLHPSGGNPGSSAPSATDKRATEAGGRQKGQLFAEVQKFLHLVVFFVPEEVSTTPTSEEPHASPDEASDASVALAHGSRPGSVKGTIDSSFGKTGKVKLVFDGPVFVDPQAVSSTRNAGGKSKKAPARETAAEDGGRGAGAFLRPGSIFLVLKKYPFALHSGLEQ